jgi:phosphatidylinositol alpha-mannosyltransferase
VRVALVCFENPVTFTGGVERHTVELGRALADLGHEVHLVTREPDEGTPDEAPWELATSWVPVPLPRGPLPAYHHRRLVRPVFHRRAASAALDAGPDLVHSQDHAGVGATGQAPTVATVHTGVRGEFEAARKPLPQGLPQRLAVAWDTRQWRRWANGLAGSIAVSPATAANLREHLGLHPAVVPNGLDERDPVDPDAAREHLDVEGRPHVVYLGRLAEVKRVDRLLDAAAHLPEGAQVTVGGDGPRRDALEQRARDHGDRVRFLGYVPEEDKQALLASADVVALPSEHEGQPIVLLEALQQGAPVVVSELGWLPADLQGHAVEAPVEVGPGALAGALVRAAEGGRVDAELPTWREVAEATVRVYEDAIG